MALKTNLKIYREHKNISQRELAELVGLTPAYIALMETGARLNPSLEVLQKLAQALGVSIEELLSKEPARG